MRDRRGGHTSGDKPYGELPQVSDRPAVGAERVPAPEDDSWIVMVDRRTGRVIR